MSHPNNLSVDYPCAGDTWRNAEDQNCLTVTGVTPSGVIYYMKGLNFGSVKKHTASLGAFQEELKRYGLGIPHYATDEYIKTYGAFNLA
jgi:hypothetical protein